MKKLMTLAIVAAFFSTGTAHAATLILDGDFANSYPSYNEFASGSSFGPWSVTSGSVDLINDYWQAPLPGQGSVDMDGATPGTIQQSFTIPTSGSYVLSFDLSGNPDGGASTKELQVTINGTTQDFSYTIGANSHGDMMYVPEVLAFNASAGPGSLTFASLDDGSSAFGAVIGNVSVSSTPLPGSFLLFGSALAGLFFFARRRQGTKI